MLGQGRHPDENVRSTVGKRWENQTVESGNEGDICTFLLKKCFHFFSFFFLFFLFFFFCYVLKNYTISSDENFI